MTYTNQCQTELGHLNKTANNPNDNNTTTFNGKALEFTDMEALPFGVLLLDTNISIPGALHPSFAAIWPQAVVGNNIIYTLY